MTDQKNRETAHWPESRFDSGDAADLWCASAVRASVVGDSAYWVFTCHSEQSWSILNQRGLAAPKYDIL